MFIDETKDFTVVRQEGLTIINPCRIAEEIAEQLENDDEIYEVDFEYLFTEYIADDMNKVSNIIWDILTEKNLDNKIVLRKPGDYID